MSKIRDELNQLIKQGEDHLIEFVRQENESRRLHDIWMNEHGDDIVRFQGIDDVINPSRTDPTLSVFYDPQDQGDG